MRDRAHRDERQHERHRAHRTLHDGGASIEIALI
jgi:hypothetical protein